MPGIHWVVDNDERYAIAWILQYSILYIRFGLSKEFELIIMFILSKYN